MMGVAGITAVGDTGKGVGRGVPSILGTGEV